MKGYIIKSNKSDSVQQIINEALNILENVGIDFSEKTERALENIAMSFLSVAGVTNSWAEAKNLEEGWLLTTREIIKFINEHFEENRAPGSYDDIRKRYLQPLVLDSLIINRSKNENALLHDPTRGYTLETEFKNLIRNYGNEDWKVKLYDFNQNRKPNINDPILISDLIFDFLIDWSENSVQLQNRFFQMRSRDDEKFEKGLWFLGDENQVIISFWKGGDAVNKTPNAYISFNIKNGISAHVVAIDSNSKGLFFESLINSLSGYSKSSRKNIWMKTLSTSINDRFLEVLNEYILNDKAIIDQNLLNNKTNIDLLFDDEYSSKFGFISEEEFYKLRSRVDGKRLKRTEVLPIQDATNSRLPISLFSLSIENFQGIEKTELRDLPSNSKWIFLQRKWFWKNQCLTGDSVGFG